jgi:sec-independent protein translocase protein TatA
MGEFSPIHWMIVLAVVVLLFGGRRIPEVMRGLGEGIRSFKEGMRGDAPPGTAQASTPAPPATAPPPTVTPDNKVTH